MAERLERVPATRLSVLERLRSGEPVVRSEAFGDLVTGYWKPVYKYVRLKWRQDEQDAADIAKKQQSLAAGLVFGLLVGAFFAFLIAAMPADASGTHYWWQIILPGSLVGLIVSYATQKYGRPAAA